jgi:hypothetical protein
MTRTPIVLLIASVIATPVAIAAAVIGTNTPSRPGPCLANGHTGYRLSAGPAANITVRIDNAAPEPAIRMQIVDNAAAADFVLVDDTGSGGACDAAARIKSVRNDPAAKDADVTVVLSDKPAERKIYVHSAEISAEDAAALFAAVWLDTARIAGPPLAGRKFAARP